MTIFLTLFLFLAPTNPPGTVKVKNYYVDITETQNIHWQEFVHHTRQSQDSAKLRKILPDSLNWFRAPGNRFKPVVLVTYEQALEYCAWRSKVVSERLGKKVTYRLPTPAEWKEIAAELLRADLKQAQKEVKENKRMRRLYPNILLGREKPKNRIYDFFGNVTEMTLEKGVAVGTNIHIVADLETNLNTTFTYSLPNLYLGFRCVAEIEE